MNSFVKKIGVSQIRKSTGHFSVSFTQRNSAAYFAGVKSALNLARSCGSISDRSGSEPALSGAEVSHPTYLSRVRAICASEIKITGAPEVHPTLSHQKLAALHHLFAVEPDVEVTANAIDVRLGKPVCSRMLGIRMTKCDVDAGDFFVL